MDTRSQPPTSEPGSTGPSSRTVLQSFLEVAGDRVVPTTLRKSVVTGLCHTIEDLVVHDEMPGAVLTAFQEARHLDVEAERYERLARHDARTVATFARGPIGPPGRVRRFQLPDDHPLTREWLLLVLTDRFSAAVFGRELGDRTVVDESRGPRGAIAELDRRFLTVWSLDPTVVADVCTTLAEATASVDVDARRTVLEAVATHPPIVPRPGISQRITNAMFERLDGGRRRWRDTAHELHRARQDDEARTRRSEQLERIATAGSIAEHLRRNGTDTTAIDGLVTPDDLQLEATDLGDWLEGVVTGLRAGGTPVGLVGSSTSTIDVDRDRLRRTVVALIDNAVAAPGRTAPVRLDLTEDDTTVQLTVSDDGTGVAPELRMNLFEPTATTHPAGTGGGLGLTIARRHVRDLGGSLELRRTGPDGTVFVVTLPRALAGRRPGSQANDPTAHAWSAVGGGLGPEADHDGQPDGTAEPAERLDREGLTRIAGGAADRTTAASAAVSEAEPAGERPCALVVDDDRAILELMRSLLPRVGWEATGVGDRERAVAAVAQRSFDAILLDVQLGTEDGPTVLRAIEAQRPGSRERAAFLTGSPPPDRRIDDRPVLGKPFEWGELERLLHRLRSS